MLFSNMLFVFREHDYTNILSILRLLGCLPIEPTNTPFDVTIFSDPWPSDRFLA